MLALLLLLRPGNWAFCRGVRLIQYKAGESLQRSPGVEFPACMCSSCRPESLALLRIPTEGFYRLQQFTWRLRRHQDAPFPMATVQQTKTRPETRKDRMDSVDHDFTA